MRVLGARAVVTFCAALIVLGAAGCQTKTGAAAVVAGQRISESDVDQYTGAHPADATQSRQFALTYLVKQKLYEQVLTVRGGMPSTGALAAYHDTAISQILSSQLGTGAAADALIAQILQTRGVSPSLAAVVVRAVELEWASYQQMKVAAAAFFPAVAGLKIPVSISPRYGSWDKAKQDLVDPVTPAFLTVTETEAPAGTVPSTAASPPSTP